MFKLKIISLLSIFLLCGCSNNIDKTVDSTSADITLTSDINSLSENINAISSNKRDWGSEGEIITSQYLQNKLEDYGYSVTIQEFPVYKQDFGESLINPLNLNPFNSDSIGTGRHVIATHPKSKSNKKTLYLTAHYDSDKKFDTIGVIDNASGTTSVLEVAKILKDYELPFNLKILFLSAEEYYLYGSRYFVSNLSANEKSNTIGAINIDMVGEKDAGDLIVQSVTGNNNILTIMIQEVFENRFKVLPGGNSDEKPFYLGKLPSITLSNEDSKTFEGDNQFDFLDLNQLKSTTDLVIEFLTKFDMSTYSNFISNPSYSRLDLKNPNVNELDDYKLIDVKETILDNGFDSEITYIYEDNSKNKYTIKEKDNRFVSLSKSQEFIILDKDNDYFYKVNKENNSSSKYDILYNWGYTYGELYSNNSLNDNLKFLDAYYISYHETVFGDKPNLSILNK